jgi:hypothetical protein
VETSGLGRREGRELRLKLPIGWSPRGWFSLSDRRHPLVLGTPRTRRWAFELTLPLDARVKRVPASTSVESACLAFSRKVEVKGRRVVGHFEVQIRCERVEPDAYAAHRDGAQRMLEMLAEELVVKVGRGKSGPTTAAR